MLNLPPLYPATDARLGSKLAEQIRRFGAAGFPLVQFNGEPLDGKAQWEELKIALQASWENGGWPAICVKDQPELALQAIQEGLRPWGLHWDRIGMPPSGVRRPPGLAFGTSPHGSEAWNSIDPACDHAFIGPLTATEGDQAEPIGFEGLRQGCLILRHRGIMPVAIGGLTLAEAGSCYQAGAESLAMAREIARASNPSELLWQAQCLRWRFRPPFRIGQGVALIGGSGCGKSTLARQLGDHLRLLVKDLDEAIVQAAGKSIARIFSEDGEPAFRSMETEITCAAFKAPAVLALGAGAWEIEAVRDAAGAAGFAVLWIAENPDQIWQRVAQDPARPLAQERETFLARWRIRMPQWLAAPMVLPLGRTPGQVADALKQGSGS